MCACEFNYTCPVCRDTVSEDDRWELWEPVLPEPFSAETCDE